MENDKQKKLHSYLKMQIQSEKVVVMNNQEKGIMKINKEVIRLQAEAASNPDHPVNDNLKAYFAERKQELEEIRKRKALHKITQAAFAVDNLHPNLETKYIFDAYNSGEIETIDAAIKALDKHYGINR